jgi:hypothetical protein
MRHGPLKVVKPVMPPQAGAQDQAPFMLEVADDDGSFLVVGSRWVRDRWAGAAPVAPSTAEQLETVERIMLREAERRRHYGEFDLERPMVLEEPAETG